MLRRFAFLVPLALAALPAQLAYAQATSGSVEVNGARIATVLPGMALR